MLQQDSPDDYVVATGESHSVREFLDTAASFAGVDWKSRVETDPRYFRPTEVDALQGDAGKAYKVLGWRPEISFEELVRSMVEGDLELARQSKPCCTRDIRFTHEGGCMAERAHRLQDSRIFVAGHRGLVGSAIVRRRKAWLAQLAGAQPL